MTKIKKIRNDIYSQEIERKEMLFIKQQYYESVSKSVKLLARKLQKQQTIQLRRHFNGSLFMDQLQDKTKILNHFNILAGCCLDKTNINVSLWPLVNCFCHFY